MESLKRELKEIDIQISDLKRRKSEIEKKLIESSSDTLEKFRNWYNGSNKGSDPYIPSNPIIRRYINEIDLSDRHRTYHVDDLFEDTLDSIMNGDVYASEQYQYSNDNLLLKDLPVLLEFMKVNIDSFTLDW